MGGADEIDNAEITSESLEKAVVADSDKDIVRGSELDASETATRTFRTEERADGKHKNGFQIALNFILLFW